MLEVQCEHTEVTATKARKSNGVVCVYLQCCECGEKTKEAPKTQYDLDRLPWFDEDFRERQRKRNAEIYKKLRQQKADEIRAEVEDRSAEWWAGYNAYLASTHWAQLRRRIIHRDQFRCQNCFSKVTDGNAQVHHLSYVGYNRLGYSFAFECVTLCRNCHKDYHQIERAGAA